MIEHPKKLMKSFRYAFEGIYSGIKTETNWKIGLLEALVVIVAGFYLKLSRQDWIIVTLMIGLVLSAELGNSAVETIVNSFTDEYHPGAKLAKDFAAGSVVIVVITAAVVGLLVFMPYIKV